MATNPYQAPRANVQDVGATPGQKLSLKEVLFSFEGRIPRKAYWLQGIVPIFVAGLVLGMVGFGIGFGEWWGYVVQFLLLWPGLAVSIKRWHDRDKSGWWVLIGLIPIIGGIWVLVENGFLRGTEGPNRFGGDATDLY
jgi:uncharacterized membrane protein YhaH (DUF805 family)